MLQKKIDGEKYLDIRDLSLLKYNCGSGLPLLTLNSRLSE